MGLIEFLLNIIHYEKKQKKESEWEELNDRLIELQKTDSYSEAIPIAKRARKLAIQIWGETHPNVATICNNLAELYEKQNRLEEAETLLLKAIQIDRKALSANHPSLGTDLNNLAELYYKQNRLEAAEPLFLEAIALGKKALPPDHPYLGTFSHNLAGLLAASDRPKAAFKLMLRGSKIDDTNIWRYFGVSSESDRLAYFQSIKGNFDFFLSLVCQYLPHSAAAKQAALNLVLKRKGLTAYSPMPAIWGDRYPHLEEKLQQWRQLGDELLELSNDIPEPEELAARREELARVQKERNDLQTQLGREIPEIRLQELSCDRKTVASCLPAGASLVEFVRFDLYDFKEKRWQDARYLAFVLPAGEASRVEMADLGDAANIDKLISQFRESLTTESESAPHLYDREAGCQLREAIFDKLRSALGSCRNLVLAPDGDLNLAPLGILPLEDGERILREECAINSVSSGRELLRNSIDFGGQPGPALAVGAPNYDFGGGDEPPPETQFETLPQTEDLAAAIGKRLGGEILLGDDALVGELLGRRSPRVLFLASSGFLFEDGQENSSMVGHLGGNLQDWMLRCGIALAGANTGSSGGELPPEAGRGVMFARDVAGWELAATELAILVLCQSEVLAGEGVLGLRRAFAVAGVKSLIMSLWEVPVYGSVLLMERFFDCLEAGAIAAEALEVAQDYLKNVTAGELRQSELGMKVLEELELGEEEPAEMKPLEHPYYWGAWVCQGG